MYKYRAFLAAATLISFMAVLMMQQGWAQAAETMFEQRINPLACTVSVIQNGSGSVASSNCGSYVPIYPHTSVPTVVTAPAPSVPIIARVAHQPAPKHTGSGFGSDNSAMPIPQSVYLNDLGKLDKAGGYMLQVMPGSVFSFRLIQEGSAGRVRSFTVRMLGDKAFVLVGTPGGAVVRVPVGGQQRVDIDGDGVIDVSLRAEYLSEDARTGVLRAVFYTPILRDRVLRDPTHEIAFVVMFSVLLIGSSHVYHRLRRSPLAHRGWLTYRDHNQPRFYAY